MLVFKQTNMFIAYIGCLLCIQIWICNGILPTRQSLRRIGGFSKSISSQIEQSSFALFSSSPSSKNNASSWTDTFSSSTSQPPVIPFDFARDDIVIEKNNSSYDPRKIIEANMKEYERKQFVEQMKKERRLPPEFYDDNARPAGYDRPDDDEEEEERFTVFNFTTSPDPLSQFNDTNDPALVRFLKDVYIGSPTDGRKRQQARFIVRSVTLISFVIGVIFTGVWYAFPGKFISFRGTKDFSARYTTEYIDPNNLLQDDYLRKFADTIPDDINNKLTPTEKQRRLLEQQLSADSIKKSEFLDDGVGVPDPDMIRVPLPKRASSESIPGRSAEL